MEAPRKLLRDIRTKEWLTIDGRFNANIAKAFEVTSFPHAAQLCNQHNDRRLEMVLKFPKDVDDVFLPMAQDSSATRR